MTAVEWFYDQIEFDDSVSMDNIEELFEQAKAMEKEQIVEAWNTGTYAYNNGEQYYNETFKLE